MAATAPSECRWAHRECRQVLPRRGLHNESLVPSDQSPTASKAQVAMVERPSVCVCISIGAEKFHPFLPFPFRLAPGQVTHLDVANRPIVVRLPCASESVAAAC